ncbi:MAG: FHA domain-containing protein [Syntrophaceae bacterium]|nr:FHA domain-containing protein [Syntrophaceae bacterium]
MARVLLKFKEALIKEIPLDKPVTTIGRKAENDIVIDNQAVSGFHAKILADGEAFAIEDLGSLNGTFVNGQRVTKVDLDNGDIVLIGIHSLEVDCPSRREADRQSQAVRGRSMDETMVIDPASQKRMLEATTKAEDVLGGFVVVEGSAEKREYELKDRVVTIGKDESAAIRLKGFFAPAVAALVNRRKEGYFMTPASGKSFKVNGQDVKTRYDLKDGDLVEVGNLKMQFFIKE